MDNTLKDYIAYYEARMKRYANNDIYINSFEAEKQLYQLVASCKSMQELSSKAEQMKELSVKTAIALIKDQEKFKEKVFEECKEIIKAKGSKAILNQIDTVKSDMELAETVSHITQKNSTEISADQIIDEEFNDTRLKILEDIEEYENAEIPEEWKLEVEQSKQNILNEGKEFWQKQKLLEIRKWHTEWDINYNLLWQERHRRLVPIDDEELKKKIILHQRYIGV